MKPVRVASSNLVYVGPTPDIGDLHCERLSPGVIESVWTFTPEERTAIAGGANVALAVMTEPIPPVSLIVTDRQGVGEDDPGVLGRLREFAVAQS